jgi:hypothetical protein
MNVDIAEMDTDSVMQDIPIRKGICPLRELPLYLTGAFYRLDSAMEQCQYTIAHQLQNTSVVLATKTVDQLNITIDRLHGALFVLSHETTETNHVGEHDRGKHSLPQGCPMFGM